MRITSPQRFCALLLLLLLSLSLTGCTDDNDENEAVSAVSSRSNGPQDAAKVDVVDASGGRQDPKDGTAASDAKDTAAASDAHDDAMTLDAPTEDTAKTDASGTGTGAADAGALDAGPVDAGSTDSGAAPAKPGFIRHYAGSGKEETPALARLPNGDLLLAGYTASGGAGDWDGLALRVSPCGQPKWQKTYGGKGKERFFGAATSSDGGAWLVGSTVTSFSTDNQALVVRINPNGTVKNAHVHGGPNFEEAVGATTTDDGGAGIIAKTYSFGPNAKSAHNMLVLRVDAAGALVWGKAFGGAKDGDAGFAITALSPKGSKTNAFLIAGATESWGAGDDDIWVMKLDAAGKHLWSRAIGSAGDDEARGLTQTSDGGALVVGFTDGLGSAKDDAFALLINGAGKLKWFTRYGGPGDERAYFALQTKAGFFVGGRSDSLGSGDDGFLARFDSAGKATWGRRVGGSKSRQVAAAAALADGSLVLSGYSSGTNSGDRDALLVRTGAAVTMGCGGKLATATQLKGQARKAAIKSFTPVIATGVKSAKVNVKTAAATLSTQTKCADSACN